MKDKKLFCIYVHSDFIWQVWIYIYGELVEKLTDLKNKEEAASAVNQWKEKRSTHHGNS